MQNLAHLKPFQLLNAFFNLEDKLISFNSSCAPTAYLQF